MKKILLVLLVIVAVAVIGFVVFVNANYEKNYNADFPIKELRIEPDSAMLARGEYLVYGPAHCADCHSPLENLHRLEMGEKVPLEGGFGLDIPPGKFYAPNITPDPETGIGNYSDGELYRMLRHNITKDGRAAFDFMPFSNMAEEDIYAIIAYLRTLPPVKSESKNIELSFIGKMVYATGGIKPIQPDEHIPQKVNEALSVEYGKYLAYAVANCRGCHTERDLKSGAYIGEEYAGGFTFGPDNMTQGWTYVTPNITFDEETGVMYHWSEDDFVARMRKGRIHKTSPMPWSAVQNMKENDLRSIYRFLKSLEPVHNEVGATATEPTT